MKPIISIIIPVYNVSNYISRCLASLINQSMPEIEIIIIDDGSTDDSLEKCKQYEKIDSRIRLYSKKNEGLGLTRNFGIEKAIGEYIAFVDSDDYVAIDMCESLYKAALLRNADIVYGDYSIDGNGKIRRIKWENDIVEWNNKEIKDSLLLDFIATKPEVDNDTIMPVSVWKALFKRSTIINNKIQFVSERDFISEDIIFDIDIFNVANTIVYIPENVYFYCVNPSSLSKKYRHDRFEQEVKLYYEVIRRLTLLNFDKKEIELRCDRFLLARSRVNIFQALKSSDPQKTVIVKTICQQSDLKKVINRYEYYKLPLRYKLFVVLEKYELVHMMKLLTMVYK